MGSCMNPDKAPEPTYTSELPNNRNIEQVDRVKSKLKITRDKIDNLSNQYQHQINLIDAELEKQKAKGLKDKAKCIYLLKQKKEFVSNVGAMQDRKKVVVKTLSDLSIRELDRNMVNVLSETNAYMDKIQTEMEANNWKEVISQAQNNQYQSPFQNMPVQSDPEVDSLYAELERQVINNQISQNTNNVQIPNANVIQPVSYNRPIGTIQTH